MKKIIMWLLIVASLVVAGYVGYKVYDYIMKDATQRIKQGVSAGVSEGIGDAVNPLNMTKKMLDSAN